MAPRTPPPSLPTDEAGLLRALEAESRTMREHQRAFFAGDRNGERVGASKRCEREVDRILAALDALRNPPPPPAQGGLFGGAK